jgi:hypothetical protein
MSDLEKNTQEEENELVLDDSIFEQEEEKKEDDFEELLTEEELESLIIGIDNENDILDIPDEEEVLEELKFLDESFNIKEDSEEKSNSKKEMKSIKKEQEENIEDSKIIKPKFDYEYFILKNKFKFLIGFVVFVVLIFVLTFFITLSKKPKIEELSSNQTTAQALEVSNKGTTPSNIVEENLSEEDKEIKDLKEELAITSNELTKKDIQQKILDLENLKIQKNKEENLKKLKTYYETLDSLEPSLMKVENDTLIVGFILEKPDYQKDLLKALIESFDDKYMLNIVSFNVIDNSSGMKKLGELTIDIDTFKSLYNPKLSEKEQLELLKYH